MKDLKPLFKNLGKLVCSSDSTSTVLDFELEEVKRSLAEHRVILFRGFKSSIDIFKKFSDRFANDFLIHLNANGRPRVSDDGSITEVVAGNERLSLHGEMYYSNNPPSILFLNCITPPEKDGETTVCDGFLYADALDNELKTLFSRKKVKYTFGRTLDELKKAHGWQSMQEAVTGLKELGWSSITPRESDGVVQFEHVASAFSKTRFGKPAFIHNILSVREVGRKYKNAEVMFEDGEAISDELVGQLDKIGEAVSERILWQAGDIAMVDNETVLHGRRSFQGPRKILTRFAL
jgi:alpha-ketoglutarate-dependent taurine dioxygenase